ncbi:nucleotide sugar dehydrogenase [Cytophagaceae bacterium ABcell3]|nr:nucleotide sugar dehydrogenase [Cytophagaceae bacterium ABcell3]
MYQKLVNKEVYLGVIGLGYVGLPIALAFAKEVKVVGFDINPERVDMMRASIDPSGELSKEDFENCDIEFTNNSKDLEKVNFFIVAVPTPIDAFNLPDLKPLLSAVKTVGKVLKKGDYVVFESTVYPGCTEEECVPVLESESGLQYIRDFKCGYSPERINPGDKEHTLSRITKVVSGCDGASLEVICKTYEIVVKAGTYRAKSIKVAEAAKIIENTQRDLNIALMNELSIIFDKMNINTYDVLEAAGTKWNFLRFTPGLVGGHCIGVDPYYLTYKAKSLGYNPNVILSGRATNDNMGAYVAKKLVQMLIADDKNIRRSKVLVLGVTFKENVSDIRNSKVVDMIKELQSYNLQVDISDPKASAEELKDMYGLDLTVKPKKDYDAVIVAVMHKEYAGMIETDFDSFLKKKGAFIDIKGWFRKTITKYQYWSL